MKNKVLIGLLLVLIGGWGNLLAQKAGESYARQVNTLIGTKGVGLTSGYLYPGATYPYGMVQFTPSYFSKRSGFVINQLSGGGCEHMGNFPTFPVKGKLKMSPDNILNYRINISEEKGHAGYYEAMVQEDIKAKLTVTERTGMASYEYPADQQYGTVIIGGGISAREDLVPELEKRLQKLVEKTDAHGLDYQVKTCQFRNDANLLGAVSNFLNSR